MKKMKSFFNTPRKAIVASVLALVVLAAIGGGVVISVRAAAESVAIGGDAAVKAAMADAGVDTNSAIVTKTKFEMEHGKYVYDVEFIADGIEYDYKVNSRTGAIVESSFEGAEGVAPSSDSVMISLDEAKKIALADAGKEASNVTVTEEKLDKDDFTHAYEIEFRDDQQEYEYKIDAYSGEILSRETKVIEDQNENTEENRVSSDQNANQSEKSDVQSTEQSENSENTDLSKVSDSKKSDQNGSGDTQNDSASSSFIGIDRAKEIALEHAGLTESEVTFSKAKTDKEHGVTVYEIEFFQGRMEYEYEINASTGEIIEWDKDYDD